MAQIQIDDNVKKEAEQIAREMGYKIVLGSKGEFGSKFIPDAVRAFYTQRQRTEQAIELLQRMRAQANDFELCEEVDRFIYEYKRETLRRGQS